MSGPTPGPWHSESWSGNESLIYAVVDGGKVHVTLTCVNEDVPLITASHALLALAHQYRNDMLYAPADDSRERRIAAIDAVLAKIGGE